MSQTKNTITLSILDKEYCIACPPEERDRLQEAARLLNERMRNIRHSGKIIGTERVAVMAALNIAYEFLNPHPAQTPGVSEAHKERIRQLIGQADRALEPGPISDTEA